MQENSRHGIYAAIKSDKLDQAAAQKILQEKVYPTTDAWYKFLKVLFLSLGIGFVVTGIVFFLAYNWQEINKFIKIGLLEVLLFGIIAVVYFSKTSVQLKQMMLTAASVMVGALFAVFGQIYQTGANAYDFFLGWTVFITLWVIVSNYAPLWLLYSILINTTLYFYVDQVADNWSTSGVTLIFILLNSALITLFKFVNHRKDEAYFPKWFLNICAMATTIFCTYGILLLRGNTQELTFTILTLLVVCSLYVLSLVWAMKHKNIYYIGLVLLSIISCNIYYIFDGLGDIGPALFLTLYSLVTFSLAVKLLVNLHKKWNPTEPKQDDQSKNQPLIIKVLIVIGTLFTCLFSLGLLFLLGLYDHPVAMIVIGLLSILVTEYFSTRTQNIFFDTLLLSFYCAGFGILGYGLQKEVDDVTWVCLVFMVLASFTVLFSKNKIILFTAILILLGTVNVLLANHAAYLESYYFCFVTWFLVYVLLHEAKIITGHGQFVQIYEPLRAALLLYLLLLFTPLNTTYTPTTALSVGPLSFLVDYASWIKPIFLMLLVLYIALQIMPILAKPSGLNKALLCLAVLMVIGPTSVEPGIPAALTILLTCFLVHYKTGFVMGIVALLYFISRFYYDLEWTLLHKSMLLLSSGILFLIFYAATKTYLTTDEKN